MKLLFSTDWITRCKKPEKAFFIHAWRFLAGLRRGELAGIKKEDIVNDVLYIRRSINSLQVETLGKNENARRYIALYE